MFGKVAGFDEGIGWCEWEEWGRRKIERRLNAGSLLRSCEREHLENNTGSCTQCALMLAQAHTLIVSLQYNIQFFL